LPWKNAIEYARELLRRAWQDGLFGKEVFFGSALSSANASHLLFEHKKAFA
jgi:hypothetical protein